MNQNEYITIKNLTKVFPEVVSIKKLLRNPFKAKNKKVVLKDINLNIKCGQIFAIVGPNGAGKTTLIKTMCSLLIPDKGEINYFGYDSTDNKINIKSMINLVSSEERSMYWRLTGRQNLKFFSSLYGLSKEESNIKIEQLVKMFHLSDHIDKRLNEYSTGLKQRLALAKSLLNNPEILFLDEPTRGLDPESSIEIKDMILNTLVKKEKRTIIYTTQLLNELLDFADIIAIINKGEIMGCGTLNDLKKAKNLSQEDSIFDIYKKYVN